MKRRCYNPNDSAYKHYGARGIFVSDEWKNDFWRFYADMGPRPYEENGQPYTVERKDNSGPYAAWNCVWATQKEQNANRRNTLYIEYNNVKLSTQDWAAILGCEIPALDMRMKRGWDHRRIIETPVKKVSVPKRGRDRGPATGKGLLQAFAKDNDGAGARPV